MSNTESNQIGSIPIVILLIKKIIVLLCVIGNCVLYVRNNGLSFETGLESFYLFEARQLLEEFFSQ